jgi:hypothetical protein
MRAFLWTHWQGRRGARLDATFYTLEGDPTSNTYLMSKNKKGVLSFRVQSVSLVAAQLPRHRRPRKVNSMRNYNVIDRIELGSKNPEKAGAISDAEQRAPGSYWLRLRNTRTKQTDLF